MPDAIAGPWKPGTGLTASGSTVNADTPTLLTVNNGATVSPTTALNLLNGATVTDGGGGNANVNIIGAGVIGGQVPDSLPDADAAIPGGHYLVTLGGPITPITAPRTYTMPQASVFGAGIMVVADTDYTLGGSVDAFVRFVAHAGDTLLYLQNTSENPELLEPGSAIIFQCDGVSQWNVVGQLGVATLPFASWFPPGSGTTNLQVSQSKLTFFINFSSILNLPGPLHDIHDNLEFSFVIEAGNLTINANAADKIADGAAVGTNGGNMTSSTVYSTLTLRCGVTSGANGVWFTTAKTGTWSAPT